MTCLEVWVNGKKVCLAGVGESGVFSSIITGGDENRKSNLHVGGLVHDEHVRWTKDEHPLEVGDVITLKIVDTDVADEPVDKSPRQKKPQN